MSVKLWCWEQKWCMVNREQKNEAETEDCSNKQQYSRRSKSRSGSARRSARHRRNSYDYFNAMQMLGESSGSDFTLVLHDALQNLRILKEKCWEDNSVLDDCWWWSTTGLGFVTLGAFHCAWPGFICVYLCVFCAFVFHTAYMLCYCQHSVVDLMGLKPSP